MSAGDISQTNETHSQSPARSNDASDTDEEQEDMKQAEERRVLSEILPDFYNQSNTMMANKHQNGDLMLMHQTRIFHFSKHQDISKQEFAKAKKKITEHIIDINYL